MPVVTWGHKLLLRNPSNNEELAEALALRRPLEHTVYDLAVGGLARRSWPRPSTWRLRGAEHGRSRSGSRTPSTSKCSTTPRPGGCPGTAASARSRSSHKTGERGRSRPPPCSASSVDAADRPAPPGDPEDDKGFGDWVLPGEFRGVDGTSAAPPPGDQPPRRLRRRPRPVRLGAARRLGRRRGVHGGPVRARISASRCDARQGGDGPPPPPRQHLESSRPARVEPSGGARTRSHGGRAAIEERRTARPGSIRDPVPPAVGEVDARTRPGRPPGPAAEC